MYTKIALISLFLSVVTCVLLFVFRIAFTDEADSARPPKAHQSYLEAVTNAPTPEAKKSAEEKIALEVNAEYNDVLKWLATQAKGEPVLEQGGNETQAISLLSDVQWYGAVNFFMQNIVWHIRFPQGEREFVPKWEYFPCAMALMKFKGCELKITDAVLRAKRQSEMELLCVTLMQMQGDQAAVKKLLVCRADGKAEFKGNFDSATKSVDGYDELKWDPCDYPDLDKPAATNPPPAATPAIHRIRLRKWGPDTEGPDVSGSGDVDTPLESCGQNVKMGRAAARRMRGIRDEG